MFTKEITDIVLLQSKEFNLDHNFVLGIIQVESSGSTFATRYEPEFFRKYIEGKKVEVFGATQGTERVCRATSFGLMQVMGQVARERGFRGAFLTALCNPQLGIQYGCSHLAYLRSRLAVRGDASIASIASAYNGGIGAVKGPGYFSNPEYPAKVLDAMPKG